MFGRRLSLDSTKRHSHYFNEPFITRKWTSSLPLTLNPFSVILSFTLAQWPFCHPFTKVTLIVTLVRLSSYHIYIIMKYYTNTTITVLSINIISSNLYVFHNLTISLQGFVTWERGRIFPTLYHPDVYCISSHTGVQKYYAGDICHHQWWNSG